jgi:hypothetical protein
MNKPAKRTVGSIPVPELPWLKQDPTPTEPKGQASPELAQWEEACREAAIRKYRWQGSD